jgi:hypothetical protein
MNASSEKVAVTCLAIKTTCYHHHQQRNFIIAQSCSYKGYIIFVLASSLVHSPVSKSNSSFQTISLILTSKFYEQNYHNHRQLVSRFCTIYLQTVLSPIFPQLHPASVYQTTILKSQFCNHLGTAFIIDFGFWILSTQAFCIFPFSFCRLHIIHLSTVLISQKAIRGHIANLLYSTIIIHLDHHGFCLRI